MLGEINNEPDRRLRLSGPGLRTFLAVADRWRLSEEQQLRIAGAPSDTTYRSLVENVRNGQDLVLDPGVLVRISTILGIYGSLASLYKTDEARLAWLHGPYNATPFNGRAPMDLVLDGSLASLLIVHDFLAALCAGNGSVPPNEIDREFRPYTDKDIVFTDRRSE